MYTRFILVAVIVGALFGLGTFTFLYAKGWSYLTNDPSACANCHIMNEQYNGWMHSSHRQGIGCNDCHTPHDFFGKWYTKARNGFWHSYYFTTGNFHEPIQITEFSRKIVENACRDCHKDIVQAIDVNQHGGGRDVLCVRCHASVGHMH